MSYLSNINIELSELQAVKSSVKTMFKNKEKEISRLTNEKENLEKNIDDLGNVIKIATFNMQKEINEFKISELDSYYAELSRIENDTEKNAKIFDDLWEAIINDKNIYIIKKNTIIFFLKIFNIDVVYATTPKIVDSKYKLIQSQCILPSCLIVWLGCVFINSVVLPNPLK